MGDGATRRGFLAGAGAAGLGAALGPANASASATAPVPDDVPFYGAHQAGIATATQEHVHFLALDLVSDVASDLAGLLAELTGAAARLASGRPVGALDTAGAPAVDTGEAVGLRPARLTVTFGLGPAVFATGRFGLQARRPAPLVELPAFATDALQPAISGGDLGVQVCADDPQVAFHAVHNLIRLASPTAVPRWSLAGFGRTRNRSGGATPRNLLGFKEGTANLRAEDGAVLDRAVWAAPPASPAWMTGGSYMVLRRIVTRLGSWDAISVDAQEATFGRYKVSGAPLGRDGEFDPLDLGARRRGAPVIPADAHVRLASPQYNRGAELLRRGYSYTDGVDVPGDAPAAGQLFICYQRDPRRQFIPIQRRLAAGDALNEHITHIGSAIFACPPGAAAGGAVGAGLFS